MLFDRMAALTAVPAGVTRDLVLKLGRANVGALEGRTRVEMVSREENRRARV